ncbi:MAG: hypothetical protein IT299_01135 [Dehalococcoidia bacterium]|nr:hypothetical protein [Dehalococcoidia bacterium]
MTTSQGRTSTYYESLLMRDRTLGLTIDEARGDLDRAFMALSRLTLN